MIREKVAHALTAKSLQSSAERERPVDVVGAMGAMSRFASLLYRLKYAGEVTWRNKEEAELFLMRRLHACRRTPMSPMTRRIASLALQQWLFDRCVVCHGRRSIGGRREVTITRRRVCKACKATGLAQRVSRHGGNVIAVCSICIGRRYVEISHVMPDEPIRPCQVCGGTGRLRMTDADLARILGISDSEQIRKCAKVLDCAMDILRRADKIAAAVLREQLAEPQFQNQT